MENTNTTKIPRTVRFCIISKAGGRGFWRELRLVLTGKTSYLGNKNNGIVWRSNDFDACHTAKQKREREAGVRFAADNNYTII